MYLQSDSFHEYIYIDYYHIWKVSPIRLFSAHDSTLVALLANLALDVTLWPPVMSHITVTYLISFYVARMTLMYHPFNRFPMANGLHTRRSGPLTPRVLKWRPGGIPTMVYMPVFSLTAKYCLMRELPRSEVALATASCASRELLFKTRPPPRGPAALRAGTLTPARVPASRELVGTEPCNIWDVGTSIFDVFEGLNFHCLDQHKSSQQQLSCPS